jgi:hypothetical protein
LVKHLAKMDNLAPVLAFADHSVYRRAGTAIRGI